MPALNEHLLDTSIQAALSSIEIYNKPTFKYREQTFTILIANAWELLLKAKILKDNADDVESIYVRRTDGSLKTNRHGNPLTIELFGAIKECGLDTNIVSNLEHLIEIRDTAVHYFHDSTIVYLVYVLGVAALKNFQKIIGEWFDKSLLEYNFYILPLAFAYNFQTLSILEVEGKNEAVANLIKSVSSCQEESDASSGFHFVCEINTQLVTAKKIIGEPDLTVQVDNDSASSTVIVERLQRLTDAYQLSYTQLCKRIKQAKPNAKQGEINKLIKELNIKGDARYSSYNFMSKLHREKFEKEGVLPGSIACIYNENAVHLIAENI